MSKSNLSACNFFQIPFFLYVDFGRGLLRKKLQNLLEKYFSKSTTKSVILITRKRNHKN